MSEDGDSTEAEPTDGTSGDSTAATRAERRRRKEPVEPEPAPARIGHFQLLERVGEGGMGAVYSAYDLRLDRKVAIKVLHRGRGRDREHRNQRLLREAQAMAKLSHPNVVPVYEVGLDGETVFIAMEYVAGATVGEWLKAKPAWRAIVDVFVQAGRGLAAAHEAGIVHRDFKPANVLVDANHHVRVTDFGIAQVRGAAPTEPGDGPTTGPFVTVPADDLTPPSLSTPLTEQGAVVGTPAYMSPEQHQRAAVDARSDQFSFCVALYEALHGKRPFSGKGDALVAQVIEGRVDRPDPGSSVPGWVTAIVLRGLEPDPERRFPSMAVMVEALGRDPGRRRRRVAVVGASALGLVAVAALAGWALRADEVEPCSGAAAQLAGVWDPDVRSAVLGSFAASGLAYAEVSARQVATVLDRYRGTWIEMHTEACRATRVRGEQSAQLLDLRVACLGRRRGELRALTTALAGPANAALVERAVEAASSLTPVDGCADAMALLAPGAAPGDPAERARRDELRARLDRLNAVTRLGTDRDALVEVRALTADARAAGDLGVLAESLRLQGAIETRVDEIAKAEETLNEALRFARQTGDVDLLTATAITLAETLVEEGITRSREGLGVVRVAEAMIGDTRDPALPIKLLVAHAKVLLILAHPEDALPLLEQAAEQCKRTLGEDHALMIKVRAVLAPALGFNKRNAEARALYTAQITSTTRLLGALHPTTISARLDICRFESDDGNQVDTAACYDPVLADADRVMGPGNRRVLIARSYYAMTLVALHRLADARRVAGEAFPNIPDEAWAEPWYIALDLSRMLGQAEVALGDFQAGMEHCERARVATKLAGQGPTDLVVDTCVGEALLGLGQPDKALAVLEKAEAGIAGIGPSTVGHWRFAYARAVWEALHAAPRARALAVAARAELAAAEMPEAPDPTFRQIDGWLASLPR